MKIRPIYKQTLITRYGRHIIGNNRGYDYDVYIKENNGQIEHKLYYVRHLGEWLKSKLLFFEDNKLIKEIKSENIRLDRNASNKLNSK